MSLTLTPTNRVTLSGLTAETPWYALAGISVPAHLDAADHNAETAWATIRDELRVTADTSNLTNYARTLTGSDTALPDIETMTRVLLSSDTVMRVTLANTLVVFAHADGDADTQKIVDGIIGSLARLIATLIAGNDPTWGMMWSLARASIIEHLPHTWWGQAIRELRS